MKIINFSTAVLLITLCSLPLQGCSQNFVSKDASQQPSTSVSTSAADPAHPSASMPESDSAAAPDTDADSSAEPEKTLLQIYNGNLQDEEKVPALADLLGGLDWHKLNEASGSGKSLEIIEYLSKNQDYITPEQYPLLFQATEGLDGASAESYSALVGELYYKNKEEIVRTIAVMNDQSKQQQIIGHIAYYLTYKDIDQEKRSLQTWLNSGKLEAEEELVVTALLDRLNHPY
ncbi:hypothetical protein [Paenibacillus jiagnxiensis]|uniref:hypothetical protein n=1 Tax=Paenibacillus jiagnxiensis TaxID=3228926 RepID=UPI0033B109A3